MGNALPFRDRLARRGCDMGQPSRDQAPKLEQHVEQLATDVTRLERHGRPQAGVLVPG